MTKKVTGASHSFRDFARRLKARDGLFAAFKPHAMRDDFPDTSEWGAIRRYLVQSGAEHEALVGARLAWRQYQERHIM